MVASAVQQRQIIIIIYIPSLLNPFHPTPIPLGHHRVLSWVPFVIQQLPTSYSLHMVVCICQCCFLNLSHSLLPQLSPQLCSLHLCIHSFPADEFINYYFSRFHIHMLIYDIYHSLTSSFSITGSRFIHLTTTDLNLFPSYG